MRCQMTCCLRITNFSFCHDKIDKERSEMNMIVPEAAMLILKDHPEGMTAKQVTDEIIAQKLYAFSA